MIINKKYQQGYKITQLKAFKYIVRKGFLQS